MSILSRLANAVRHTGRRPPLGMVAAPRDRDSSRTYPADGLTPQRLGAILRAADAGDLEEQLALYEQMEEKDAHLFCIAQTRRLALTGLDWRIVSASDVEPRRGLDADLAARAAAYCADSLANIEDLDLVLAHLALALGRNIAVAELVWQADGSGVRLAEIVPVAFDRLRAGPDGAPRILTAGDPRDGIAPMPEKFIVHRPHGSTHTAHGGLLRVTTLAFIAKNYAMKDWLIFMEVFGMPIRVARYNPGATPEEKRELLDMMRRLGTDAAGIFSKAVELDIKQTRVPGDVAPYESICHFFNREMSKAWLGQTLTTDTARALNTARGAADVHDRVRRDIRDADLRAESRTIRRDLLTPLTRLRFGPHAPVPYFVRQVEHPRDPRSLAEILSLAVNDLGAKIPAQWAHEALSLPRAADDEPTLAGRFK